MADKRDMEKKWQALVDAHGTFIAARDAHNEFVEGSKVKHKRKHQAYENALQAWVEKEGEEFVSKIV